MHRGPSRSLLVHTSRTSCRTQRRIASVTPDHQVPRTNEQKFPVPHGNRPTMPNRRRWDSRRTQLTVVHKPLARFLWRYQRPPSADFRERRRRCAARSERSAIPWPPAGICSTGFRGRSGSSLRAELALSASSAQRESSPIQLTSAGGPERVS